MESLEISAKTEEEAVAIALERLSADRDEVDVEVIKKGKSGFLGIGGEEATVRVSRRQPQLTADEAVDMAEESLEKLLSLMGVSATIERKAVSPEGEAPVVLDITGQDLGILIGRRGQTLFSLQHLIYLMVSHKTKSRVPVIIDVEGYRERRRESLVALARRVAESVEASGQSVSLEPMPAYERRIVHLALQSFPGVTTESEGDGESRKVTIRKR